MDSATILNTLQRDWGTAQFNENWIMQDWQYWDMVGYASSNEFVYFSVPAGQNDPNLAVAKKREQTNLNTPNQIGGDECFVATHLRCFVLNSAKVRQLGTAVAANTTFSAAQLRMTRFLQALMSQGVLRWKILNKDWLIQNQPWETFPAGFGLGVVIPPALGSSGGATPVSGGANAYTNSSPFDIDGGKNGDTFSLAQPVFLAPNTSFNISIQFPLGASPSAANLYGASGDTANQTGTLWTGIVLQGFKVRPRQ